MSGMQTRQRPETQMLESHICCSNYTPWLWKRSSEEATEERRGGQDSALRTPLMLASPGECPTTRAEAKRPQKQEEGQECSQLCSTGLTVKL